MSALASKQIFAIAAPSVGLPPAPRHGTPVPYDNLGRVSELVGETVDTRYELRRLIAHGGMGLVFEAHHKLTRRTVALKLLPDELRAKKEARGRLLREAHALTITIRR